MSRRPNPESIEAHTAGDKEQLRNLALAYIRSCRERGATADEAVAALGLVHNSIAPRLTELKSSGLIMELYDAKGNRVRRKTRMGCAAGVLVAAEFAPKKSTIRVESGTTLPLFATTDATLMGSYRDPEEVACRRCR